MLQRIVTVTQIFTEYSAIILLVYRSVVFKIVSEMIAVESHSAADGQAKMASLGSVLQALNRAFFILTLTADTAEG